MAEHVRLEMTYVPVSRHAKGTTVAMTGTKKVVAEVLRAAADELDPYDAVTLSVDDKPVATVDPIRLADEQADG